MVEDDGVLNKSRCIEDTDNQVSRDDQSLDEYKHNHEGNRTNDASDQDSKYEAKESKVRGKNEHVVDVCCDLKIAFGHKKDRYRSSESGA